MRFVHFSFAAQKERLEGENWNLSEMNLYRSFGDLMEVYVYEERTHPESHWHQDNADGPPAPVSNMAVNPRSESVDSGVETASCETPNPTSGNFLSTDNTEIEIFQLPRDRFSPASTSQSPVLTSSLPSSSSSSPNMCSSRAEKEPTPLNLKGEPELQRTDSKRWKQVYEVLSHQPKSSSLPKQHTSDLKRCIRSASFNMRRRFDPSVPTGNVSETQREPLSVGSVEQISQVQCFHTHNPNHCNPLKSDFDAEQLVSLLKTAS